MLIKDPEHRPDNQEDEKEREDHHGTEDEGLAAIGDVAAREDHGCRNDLGDVQPCALWGWSTPGDKSDVC